MTLKKEKEGGNKPFKGIKVPWKYKDDQQKIYFEWLDNLRAGGTINMFEAPFHLRSTFPLTREESFQIFEDWAFSFGPRGCPGRDKE